MPGVSVVGAEGFLAAPLVRALALLGDPVHTFTRQRPAVRDGLADPALVDSSVIFYLASRLSPAVAERDLELVAADRADFRTFLDALSGVSHRPVVVLASSGGTVYDPDFDPPHEETSRIRATSAYGAVKLFKEAALIAMADRVSPVILRLSNVYGPGQRTDKGYGVIGHWMEAALLGEPIRVLGDPRTRRDYVHIDDVVAALLAVRRQTEAFRVSRAPVVLNIGSGVPTTLDEVRLGIEDAIGRGLPVRHEQARSFDRRDVWLDVSRARSVLDWRPAIALVPGLMITWRQLLDLVTPTVATSNPGQV